MAFKIKFVTPETFAPVLACLKQSIRKMRVIGKRKGYSK